MNTSAYNQKAANYARFRWDYPSEAVEAIFTLAKLGENSVMADLGAGTGMLTFHFAGRVGMVYAVEPNAEMRREAAARLATGERCRLIDATAEDTSLPPSSVDLVTVAQAIHWFEPEHARAEIRRILKPGGRLAVLWNTGLDEAVNRAAYALMTPEYGYDPGVAQARPASKPLAYYFGSEGYQSLRFPFSFSQGFERFFGALLSTSGMPDEGQPGYDLLKREARRIFDRHSTDGVMMVHGVTELYIGEVE